MYPRTPSNKEINKVKQEWLQLLSEPRVKGWLKRIRKRKTVKCYKSAKEFTGDILLGLDQLGLDKRWFDYFKYFAELPETFDQAFVDPNTPTFDYIDGEIDSITIYKDTSEWSKKEALRMLKAGKRKRVAIKTQRNLEIIRLVEKGISYLIIRDYILDKFGDQISLTNMQKIISEYNNDKHIPRTRRIKLLK